MLNILYAMLYFYSFHDASVFLRAFPLQKQKYFISCYNNTAQMKASCVRKTFFFAKSHLFQKKGLLLQTTEKRGYKLYNFL